MVQLSIRYSRAYFKASVGVTSIFVTLVPIGIEYFRFPPNICFQPTDLDKSHYFSLRYRQLLGTYHLFPRSFQFLAFSTLRYSDFEEICRIILTCGELPTHGFYSHVKEFFRGYYAFQKLYQDRNNTVAKLGLYLWHPLSRNTSNLFSLCRLGRICCKPTLKATYTIFQSHISLV